MYIQKWHTLHVHVHIAVNVHVYATCTYKGHTHVCATCTFICTYCIEVLHLYKVYATCMCTKMAYATCTCTYSVC